MTEDGDDFETDEEDMDVSAMDEEKQQAPQKRKKVSNDIIYCISREQGILWSKKVLFH